MSAEVRENSFYLLNIDIFLTKMHRFTTGGLYSAPGACERALFIMDGFSLLDFFWTVEWKTAHCHYKAREESHKKRKL